MNFMFKGQEQYFTREILSLANSGKESEESISTGETVRSNFYLMDLTLSKSIPRLLIFIDFHKTFDSLKFGPDFICLVEIFVKEYF